MVALQGVYGQQDAGCSAVVEVMGPPRPGAPNNSMRSYLYIYLGLKVSKYFVYTSGLKVGSICMLPGPWFPGIPRVETSNCGKGHGTSRQRPDGYTKGSGSDPFMLE